jgi:hypothetical protein
VDTRVIIIFFWYSQNKHPRDKRLCSQKKRIETDAIKTPQRNNTKQKEITTIEKQKQ